MSIKPEYHTLSNGIRLMHMRTPSPVAHLGVFINTGTRDEPDELAGLAHFIEHMIFKGTKKRKAYHILNRLENVGGELNAFTTREYTCIYSSFLNTWYSRAAELLADITFHSTFPAGEMRKERDVIIEEINSYKDSPSDLIYDDFEAELFRGHPLGRAILGTPESVKAVRKTDLVDFFRGKYCTDRMVLCSVGNINFNRLVKILERYFLAGCSRSDDFVRKAPGPMKQFNTIVEKNTYQSHTIIGNRAYAREHESRYAFGLLNNILGGPGMNSRLNMMVREKHGYAYTIDSFYFPFSDTGIWGIYLGTHNGTSAKAIELVMKELRKLREVKLGTLQLSRAHKQYKGQIAIAFDSNVHVMLSAGRSCLHDHCLLSLADMYSKIDKITVTDLMEVANEIFNPDEISSITYAAI